MNHFVVVVVCVIVFIISRRKQSHDIVGCQNKGQKTKFPGMFHGLFLMSELEPKRGLLLHSAKK